MFFVSLSTKAGIFTSFSHETSLWCSATLPTVFTQSREDYYRGIADNSTSPHPEVPFVLATGLSVVTRQPLDNSRCHLAVVPRFIKQAADLDNCGGAFLLCPHGNRKTALRFKWASSFCASSFRIRGWWREWRGEQLHNTWAESGEDKSSPLRLSLLCSAHQAPHLLLFRTMSAFIQTLFYKWSE